MYLYVCPAQKMHRSSLTKSLKRQWWFFGALGGRRNTTLTYCHLLWTWIPNFYFKMFTPLVIASVLYHVLAAQMKIPCMCSLTWLILDWPDSCPDSSRVLKSFRKCQESSWRNDLMVLGTFTCHHMIIKTVGYVELASRARSVLPADLYSDYYIISINIL